MTRRRSSTVLSLLLNHRILVLRAAILAGLAALVLATHVFVAIDRARVKLVEAPTTPVAGVVHTSFAGFRDVSRLRPPFALVARIDSRSSGPARFSVTVDDRPICEPAVSAGLARIDCVVSTTWNPAVQHD